MWDASIHRRNRRERSCSDANVSRAHADSAQVLLQHGSLLSLQAEPWPGIHWSNVLRRVYSSIEINDSGPVQGYSEAEIESILAPLRRLALHAPDEGSAVVTRAEAFPDTRLRQRSPPDLAPELLWSLRMGAIRLFKVPCCPALSISTMRRLHRQYPNWPHSSSRSAVCTA